MVLNGKNIKERLSLFDIGLILLIATSLFNTSKYGASFSWIIIPFLMVAFGVILKGKIILNSTHLFAVLFWITFAFSTLISPVVTIQRNIVTSALFAVLFILVTGTELSEKKSQLFIYAYFFIALAGSALILYNWINGIYYNVWFQRSTVVFMGVSRDPNYVAGFIAPIPIMLILFPPKNTTYLTKIIRIIFSIIVTAALVLCGSRGAIISAFIPVVLYFLFKIKRPLKKYLVIICTIVFIFIGYLLIIDYLPPQTVDRLLLKQGGGSRVDLWKSGLIPFYNNPVIGQGLGSSSYYSNSIIGNDSHNMYVDILSSSGVIGFLFYIVMVFKSAFKGKGYNFDIVLLCIAFFAPQFFINGFNTLSMWMPILMIYFCNIHINTVKNTV